MAKKRGKRGKRGSRITFGPKGQVRRGRKPSKKQKFIRKISSDGRVSKKEMRKARKKGISLRAIERRNIKDYRQNKKTYSRTPTERRGSRRPTYEPLLISRGAERLSQKRVNNRSNKRPTKSRPSPNRQVKSDPQLHRNQYQQEIQNILGGLGGQPEQTVTTPGGPDPNQDYLDAIAGLQETIAGMDSAVPDYSAEFESMRAEQERLMAEMAARQAEQERLRELAFRTSQENAARGGMVADFRIGARSPRDQMGTSGFKRRPRRRPTTITQGIAPTTAGQTINI